MELAAQACTRRSAAHADNEDRAVVGREVLAGTRQIERLRLRPPTVIAVLDGLGGHPAGAVASDVAARHIARADAPVDERGAQSLLEATDRAVLEAARDPGRHGMGTTAVLLAVGEADNDGVVANMGDSLAWKVVGGELVELTVSDRSFGSMLVQSLGGHGGGGQAPHVARVPLAPGERVLLASDGLSDVVSPEDVVGVLRDHPDHAAERLLGIVEQAGPPDDVTIVVIDVAPD